MQLASAEHWLLTVVAHDPVVRAVFRQLSHESPLVLTEPFKQYSFAHLVVHAPLEPQTQPWMIAT